MPTQPKALHKQSGVALIVVLMLVALVVIITADMASRLQLQVTRASNIKDNNQAYWYAMGAEQFAQKSILALLQKNENVISLEGDWSQEFTFPLEGGGIQAQLLDMQTCFNLNAVNAVNSSEDSDSSPNTGTPTSPTDANGQQNQNKPQPVTRTQPELGAAPEEAIAFARLLQNAVPELDNYSVEVVRDSLIDWLDSDDNLSQSGAEDADYAALVNPYLAANANMVSKSEFRLVNGVQAQWVNQLLPQICVIPKLNELKINVNTVVEEQAPVLAALTGASVAEIQTLISNRRPSGYENIQDFLSETLFSNYPLNAVQQSWFDVKTEYFLLHTKTRYNNASFAMSSLFKVQDKQKVTVIRREFGGKL
ncbi:type II secretion system minor pseudopilin GspK [Aliiglaciecola litoralis]|uniref:Type II secretion system protein K n=1 Tax=Aliiglaciecola litoralis TaxID=582857 RepID=A0ABN1LF23_9ALTE